MLKRTPSNSDIIMVRLGREDADDWKQNVNVMEEVLQRPLELFPEPLLKTRRIKEAHNSGGVCLDASEDGPQHRDLPECRRDVCADGLTAGISSSSLARAARSSLTRSLCIWLG